jgi:alpha-beta hydrolase superfamily lysophospholipase
LAEALAPVAARIDTWTASDGYRAHYRAYVPTTAPKANLVCLHGIQSHGGWYDYSSSRFCQAGYAVYYLDRRGSGLNQEARGHTSSAARLLDDIREFIGQERLATGPAPLVLMGCSWGGKLAAAFCARYPTLAEGLVLLYPGIVAKIGPRPAQRLRILLTRFAQPTKRFPIPLNDPELFTGEPRWQRFIAADPLALRWATAGFLVSSAWLDFLLARRRTTIRQPTLLLLAGRDGIIDNRWTRRRVRRLCKGFQRVIVYPEAHHTLEFEPDRDQFINDTVRWLDFVANELQWKRQRKLTESSGAGPFAPMTDVR